MINCHILSWKAATSHQGAHENRTHEFMTSHRVSDTGVIPDYSKKRMTNISIEFDGTAMLHDSVTLYKSNANVVLCPHSISIATTYTIAAKHLVWPLHTLYE